jgi:hypothetical protein
LARAQCAALYDSGQRGMNSERVKSTATARGVHPRCGAIDDNVVRPVGRAAVVFFFQGRTRTRADRSVVGFRAMGGVVNQPLLQPKRGARGLAAAEQCRRWFRFRDRARLRSARRQREIARATVREEQFHDDGASREDVDRVTSGSLVCRPSVGRGSEELDGGVLRCRCTIVVRRGYRRRGEWSRLRRPRHIVACPRTLCRAAARWR